jgi:hypothetical protein
MKIALAQQFDYTCSRLVTVWNGLDCRGAARLRPYRGYSFFGTALVIVCALTSACATSRKSSPVGIVRGADPVLGRSIEVRQFESRLNELGATIATDPVSGDRTAIVVLPGKPGYFPPRTLQIVYIIGSTGLIELKSAELTSLGSKFARVPESREHSNNMPEPTPRGVMPSAGAGAQS